jgi:sec-independent protein translocase protein TatC
MANPQSTDSEQPFFSHLLELRDRLLRVVLAVLVLFLCLAPFANDLYTAVARPMVDALPEGATMIATQIASPFLTPFKLSLVAAIFLAMPYILFQAWGFVAPGLYQHERRLALPLLGSSIVLFYLGMAFAYFVVFPLVFAFLTGVTPEGVQNAPDISYYLDFLLTLFFAFGIAFEVPIATILMVWAGLTTPEQLSGKRPYVIVGAFVIGMFLTPPDIISQTLLALPMWILFELGVFFSRMFVRARPESEPDSGDDALVPAGGPGGSGGNGGTGGARASVSAATAATAAPAQTDPATAGEGDQFTPLTDEEMDAELDRIEAEEDDGSDDDEEDDRSNGDGDEATETTAEKEPEFNDEDEEDDLREVDSPTEAGKHDLLEEKLRRANELRESMEFHRARELLYEVLVEGDEEQIKVARNILSQLDD